VKAILDGGDGVGRNAAQALLEAADRRHLRDDRAQAAFCCAKHERVAAGIPAGGEYVWKGGRTINEYIDEDRKLMHLENGQFSTEMQPTMVMYADGSRVGGPDEN
jgi:hypothetical protein